MSATSRSASRGVRRGERGFSLVSAIFLVVILTAVAAYAVSFATAQHQSSALDVTGARALVAARAGVEWGAYQSLRLDSCVASSTLGFAGTPLAPMGATVACTRLTGDEAGATVVFDSLVVTACNEPPCPNAAPGPRYVERQLNMMVAR